MRVSLMWLIWFQQKSPRSARAKMLVQMEKEKGKGGKEKTKNPFGRTSRTSFSYCRQTSTSCCSPRYPHQQHLVCYVACSSGCCLERSFRAKHCCHRCCCSSFRSLNVPSVRIPASLDPVKRHNGTEVLRCRCRRLLHCCCSYCCC